LTSYASQPLLLFPYVRARRLCGEDDEVENPGARKGEGEKRCGCLEVAAASSVLLSLVEDKSGEGLNVKPAMKQKDPLCGSNRILYQVMVL